MAETYVMDAHAFARYLTNDLPKEADAILEKAEKQKSSIVIPAIAIAELIYVFERTKSETKIWEMFDKIDIYPSFFIHPLDEEVLKIIPDVRLSELRDRIIVATCIAVKAEGLITKDEEIKKSKLVKTIW
jgi:predicted nucleic acid-binding protein